MARTRIEITGMGSVRLSYIHPMTEEPEVRFFSVPPGGGYVRDDKGNQVCQYLSGMGNTLRSDPDNLLSLIRTEWARSVRALREDEAKWRHR